MRISFQRIAIGMSGLLLALTAPGAFAHANSDPICTTAGQQPDVIAARADLQHTPDVLEKRLHLGDLLMNAGCFDEAVQVLEAGEASNARNSELQYRLRRARSMLKEKEYFDGVDQAEAAARMRRNVLRCNQFSDLEACDAILSVQPTNPDIVLAKGNALMKANRIDDAIAAYTQAVSLAPTNPSMIAKLQAAQAQRQATQKTCKESEGDAALQACQALLVKGASNEFDLTVRIAILQQSTNQAPQALDSYIAANSLRPGDKSIALATLSLLDSTQRKDPIALAARGSSLLTLGRAGEAVVALRQAASLAPSLPGIDRQLAAAEAQAKQAQGKVASRGSDATADKVAVAAPKRTSFSNLEPASHSN